MEQTSLTFQQMFSRLKMNLWILGFKFINLVENHIMRYLFVLLLLGLVSCGDDTTGDVKKKQRDKTITAKVKINTDY
jgi:hypothetical protein